MSLYESFPSPLLKGPTPEPKTSISNVGQRFAVFAWICKVSTRIEIFELSGKATLYVCKVVSSTNESHYETTS